ncbi:hypothetical protein D3C72_2242990 [compost metagenome]
MTLPMNTNSGLSEVNKEVKPLGTVCSATVVNPLAPTIISDDKIICRFACAQPFHVSSFFLKRMMSNITVAIVCLNAATNQGGIVCTATRMPK